MKLQVPFIQLPLLFDADRLALEIAALGEDAWRPHPQGFAGNSMLPLLAVDGDAGNESFAGPMQPTAALRACPYLMHVLHALGATLGRTRLMRLSGHAEVIRHADQGYYWGERVRVHIPVVTQPTVRFECGDAAIHMAAGECWIFDTWRQHRVINDARESRIHLVIDTVGGEVFWDLAADGRPHDAPRGPGRWEATRFVPPQDAAPALSCEALNVPLVMTPWEINTQLLLLFGDALPHPELQRVQMISSRFLRIWRGLWARFGDTGEGLPHYRAALQEYVEATRLPASSLILDNQIHWYNAMMTLIGKVAVAPDNVSPAMANEHGIADRA